MHRSDLKTQVLLFGIVRKVPKRILLKVSIGNFKVSMGKTLTFTSAILCFNLLIPISEFLFSGFFSF